MSNSKFPSFQAFLNSLTQPLSQTAANSTTIDLTPNETWTIPASLAGQTANLTFGFDAQFEIDVFTNINAIPDADGVLGPPPSQTSGGTSIDDPFKPLTFPPFVIFNAGDVWLKARLKAGISGSTSLSFDGVDFSSSGTAFSVVAVYRKIANPSVLGSALPPTLFSSVLDALVPPAAVGAAPAFPISAPGTVLAFEVGAGMNASVSIDLIKLLEAVFGFGLPALKVPANLPVTVNLGPSAVINASCSVKNAHTVALWMDSTTPAGYLQLGVALSDTVNTDVGGKLSITADAKLDGAFYNSLQQVLTTVNNAINWDPATITALVNNPTFTTIVDVATQNNVKQLVQAFASWQQIDLAATPFGQVYTQVQTFVTTVQTTLKQQAEQEISVSMSIDYSLTNQKSSLLTAQIPVADAFTHLTALLAGDLTGVQNAALAGTVLNCTTLGQSLTTATSTFAFNLDLIAFDAATKDVVEDVQALVEYIDSHQNKTSMLGFRRTWIGDNSVQNNLGKLGYSRSFENNIALLANQSSLNSGSTLNTFDILQLDCSWQIIVGGAAVPKAYAIAADHAAVLGLIPFANIPSVATQLQANAAPAGAAPAKIQIDAAWTVPLESLQAVPTTIVNLGPDDIAAAFANAMPWNFYGDEKPVVFKVDDIYRGALAEIWKQFLNPVVLGTVNYVNLNQKFLSVIANLTAAGSEFAGPAQNIYNNQQFQTIPGPHGGQNILTSVNDDVKFLSLIRSDDNYALINDYQRWLSGIRQIDQGYQNHALASTVLEGPPVTAGAFDYIGYLCLDMFLSRIQAALVVRALLQLPGIVFPQPTVSVKSLDAAGKVLQTQSIRPA
jgi:hypothetical protein